MSTCFYFAFGSNMLRERLRVADRCMSARPLGAATAIDHRVTMWKRSARDGTGKATLVRAEGEIAHGVLYEVATAEIPLLDKSEGVGKGYYREEALQVVLPSGRVAAHTYIAPPEYIEETLLPFDWYAALCLAGALQHALPGHHVDWLRTVPSLPDPQPDREQRQRALRTLRAAGFPELAEACRTATPAEP